jgi:putative Holliday junction resolvase
VSPIPGRLIAVDWGDKRIGLAITDELRMIASPVGVITRRAGKRPPVAELLRRAQELEATAMIMGLPLDGNGDETERCAEVRIVAAEVTKRSGMPVRLVDERFTTAAAHRAIREMGGSTEGRKGDVDALAATVLLQHAMALQPE